MRRSRGHVPRLRPSTQFSLHRWRQIVILWISLLICSFVVSYSTMCLLSWTGPGSRKTDIAGFIIVLQIDILPLMLCLLYIVLPDVLPLQQLFVHYRYRRTHISHLRKDRLQRMMSLPAYLRYLEPGTRERRGCYAQTSSARIFTERPVLSGGGSGQVLEQVIIYDLSALDGDDNGGTVPFRPSEWLGLGKIWSEDLPDHVILARDTARRVPRDIRDQIIPPMPTVAQLLAVPPPTNDENADIASESPVYGTTPPTLSPFPDKDELAAFHHFLLCLLPHIPLLCDTFNNAWLAGCSSIYLPSQPDYRIPLWSVRLLEDLRIVERQRQRWYSTLTWLSTLSDTSDVSLDLAAECRTSLLHIPYNGSVSGFSKAIHLSMSDLSLFLSDDWLNDEMINAGSEHIIQQLGRHSKKRIANCFLVSSLMNMYSAKGPESNYHPRRYSILDTLIRNGTLDVLYIPLHVNNNHWTLLEVNIKSRTFAFADSLKPMLALPPSKTLKVIQWWLNALQTNLPNSSTPFSVITPQFDVPLQTDTYSCGVVVLTLLAHILLGGPSWTSNTRHHARMRWFLLLSKDMVDPDDESFETDNCDSFPESPSSFPDPSNNGDSRPPSPTFDSISMGAMNIDVVHPEPSSDDNNHLPSTPFDSISMDIDVVHPTPDSTSNSHIPPATLIPAQCSSPCLASVQPTSKRSRSESCRAHDTGTDADETDGDDINTSDEELHATSKRVRIGQPNGVAGSSYARQKAVKTQLLQDPMFNVQPKKLEAFRSKIRKDDSHAEFNDAKPLAVRCSSCSRWVSMRLLYDTLHWKNHRSTQKCQDKRSKTGKHQTPSLLQYGFGRRTGGTSTISKPLPVPLQPFPCPGLRRSANPQIDAYFYRSTSTGGGAPSRLAIAKQLFADTANPHKEIKLRELSADQMRMVRRREEMLYKWQNSRAAQAVYASDCEDVVNSQPDVDVPPCSRCAALYHLHTFQVALNRPVPLEENMKHTRKDYRDEDLGQIYLKHKGVRQIVELDDGRSPWLKFAQGVASGLYNGQDTLLGMVTAMVHKTERLRKGRGLSNMKYTQGFSHYCNILASASVRAYKTFHRHFGGPGIRSMRRVRAKLPRFAPGIMVNNIDMARAVLQTYNYTGPIALSWDDTELEPALTAYQQSKETVLVLGSIHGPKELSSMDEVDDFFEQAKFEKATKLRIWLATIPLPKIPPILLAAVARGSSVSADDLLAMHLHLVHLLHDDNIFPVSMSADGSETERSLQRLVTQTADSTLPFSINNSTPGCRIDFSIPIFRGRPCIMTQDSKHAKKTARNQLTTGARLIIFANVCIFFSMIHAMASNVLSPLFKRDVDKVDKQDDRAAARLFSSQMLNFQMTHYPEHSGLSVYLFILGELVDAWQSRNITHLERAKMVLRARFFLMAWRSHIVSHPDYSVNIQFISRESYDIFMTLCDSLLALIIVYRKYYPLYPLLLWLHSTEPCEHIFGILRQLKADFNYSDMLFLEPKLRTLLLGEFGNLTAEQQANQTSAGCHHTYFKTDGLDLLALLQYPSDNDLSIASQSALSEATDLLATVGIDAVAMLAVYQPPVPKTKKNQPPVHVPRQPQTLAEILTLFKDVPLQSSKDEAHFEACEMALAAQNVDKTLHIESLLDAPDTELYKIKDTITAFLHPTLPEPPSNKKDHIPFTVHACNFLSGRNLDQLTLVQHRERHQTKETSMAIRQLGREWPSYQGEPSLHATLQHRLRAIAVDQRGSATGGVGRQVRHGGTPVSIMAAVADASTRKKNKEVAQGVAAAEFVRHRSVAFQHLQVIHEHTFAANIIQYNPLRAGHFILALRPAKKNTPPQLLLGEVVTMYTKADYKGAKYDDVPELRTAGHLSHLYILLYQEFGPFMTSLSCPKLSCSTVLRIPRTHIIFSLAGFSIAKQKFTSSDAHPFSMITLGPEARHIHALFLANLSGVKSAVDSLVALTSSRNTPALAKSEIPPSDSDSESDDGVEG